MNNIIRKSEIVFCVLLLCTFLANSSLHAQKRLEYSGPFVTQFGLEGEASYSYYIEKGDTIKDGHFEFNWSRRDTVDADYILNIGFSGQFKKGKKEGEWVYSHKNLKPHADPVVRNRTITYTTKGTAYYVFAKFKDGKAIGDWEVTRYFVENSEPTDTVYSFKTQYRDGKMTGDASGYWRTMKFSGSFNDQGRIDGLWRFQDDSDSLRIEERRLFDDGVLIQHYFLTDKGKEVDTLNVNRLSSHQPLGENFEMTMDVLMDSVYLRYLQYTTLGIEPDSTWEIKSDSFVKRADISANLLSRAIFSTGLHRNREIWRSISDKERKEYPHAKMYYMPYPDSIRKALAESHVLLRTNKQKIETFFKNPQTEVSRYTYDEMAYYFEVYGVLRESVNKLDTFLVSLSDSAVVFIEKEKLIDHIAPEINFPKEIEYSFRDSSRQRDYDFPGSQNLKELALPELFEYINKVSRNVSALDMLVAPILDRHERKERITDKEKKFIAEKDSVIALFSNKSDRKDYNDYHRQLKDIMVDLAEQQIKSYTALGVDEKVDRITDYIDCMERSKKLYKMLAAWPGRQERLDELYTRTVWNPYTYTDMYERMKERVYKAYEEKLYPLIWNDLKDNLHCQNMNGKINNFNRLYSRMVDIREQDTKDMERQIRRARNTDQLIEVFDIVLDITPENK